MKNSIRLHSDDNIVIALKDFEKGSCFEFNAEKIVLQEPPQILCYPIEKRCYPKMDSVSI